MADYAVQAIICSLLADEYPEDPVVGEEDSILLRTEANAPLLDEILKIVTSEVPMSRGHLLKSIDRGNFIGGGSSRFWTLDPIDGTKGFLRGGQFSICLALIVDGSVKGGVGVADSFITIIRWAPLST